MASVVMQILSQEVRAARNLRVHREAAAAEAEAEAAAAGDEAATKPQAPKAGGLADHVKKQLRTFGTESSGGGAASASSSTSSALPIRTRTFLESASDRSRGRDLDRRRNLIAVSSRAGGDKDAGGGMATLPVLTTSTFSVSFKFHEGFTNAVRRPVVISDFC